MAEYVCENQGHRFSFATLAVPPPRCPEDQSALIAVDGSRPAGSPPDPSVPDPRTPVSDVAPRSGLRPVGRLQIAFGDTVVTVPAGERVMLGRDPEYSPYGEQFGRHDNVSRRHAEIGLDAGGRAWIRDCYSTNLTRVESEPLVPGQGRELRAGQTVRLCRDVWGTVELLREDPDAR